MATFDQKNSVFHLLKMQFIYYSEFVAQQNVIKSFCLKLGHPPTPSSAKKIISVMGVIYAVTKMTARCPQDAVKKWPSCGLAFCKKPVDCPKAANNLFPDVSNSNITILRRHLH